MSVDNDDNNVVNDEDELDELEIELIGDTEATEYSIATDLAAGEAKLEFFNDGGSISTFVGTSDEIYTLAQRLLRAYDKLEGL
jgi:hypothetical protein